MKFHEHVAECWERYEPCGEHHRHSYDCGNGQLSSRCPMWKPRMKQYLRDSLCTARYELEIAKKRSDLLNMPELFVEVVQLIHKLKELEKQVL